MLLEETEVVVDVADQAGPARQQEHGTDAARAEPLDPIGELVVDVARGDHRLFAFRFGRVLDAVEDSLLAITETFAVALSRLLAIAFSGLLGESGSHSKTSEVWNSEDLNLTQLFHKLRGFSSIFR